MPNMLIIVLAGLFNGVGDFFSKMTAGKISPYLGGIFLSFFAMIPSAIYLFVIRNHEGSTFITKMGFLYSACAGLFIGVGVVFFYVIFHRGINISFSQPIVKSLVVLTAVILGVIFLREKMSISQIIGLLFSLVGIYFLSK